MISSLSPSTIKQYEKPLRLWWLHCKEKDISVFDTNTATVIDFLSNILPSIGSCGTLNSYRSALSLISKSDIGSDPLIMRFFKGVSIMKPQKPRYDLTWDPQIVLNYLKTLFPNENLPLDSLTQKLVILVSLVTSQRVQTISKISIHNIIQSEEFIQIKIPDRVKSSKLNKSQPCLTLPFFKDQPEVCVASALQTYINRTANIRNSIDKLFLTYKKPIKAATTQTLARWIKVVLSKSGIDTSIFKAHSTRHASTSAAERQGMNIDVIRQTAGWSENSKVFALFYKRPVVDKTAYARAVLAKE